MNDHYFTSKPSAASKPVEFQAELRGRTYVFQTDTGVFSKGELDMGSRILIETMSLRRGDRVLDLGCGYGPLGLVAADLVGPLGKVYMVDVNERAGELARENMAKNGITNAQIFVGNGIQALPPGLRFDAVLSNPPIRAGKAVFYPLLSEAYHILKPGGCLWVVIRTKQGAKSLQAYLEELAGSCQTMAKKAGFRVLKCCKQLHT
ncbi:MAG: methyltransferase [Bacillota bacterium]|jgi:16S rRNA (guanine1207-N2)-methyltransferase|nr:methyltransferase [Bacillota bacterium]HHT90519.1 class I SAM-dependent methyltransferase [Bacillota bacterium]